MKDQYKINKVEHVWDDEEDRWIYIEYNAQGEIIGLNFMQGDEYDCFKKRWCKNDQGLMEFYDSMLYTFPIEKSSVSALRFINKCMWAFHTALASREEYPQ